MHNTRLPLFNAHFLHSPCRWHLEQRLWGSPPIQYQFTGQLSQPEAGLIWFSSRFYDPSITHFVQPDSIIPGLDNKNVPTDGYAWNHYAYVDFNPITKNDPSGHDVDCAGEDASQCAPIPILPVPPVIPTRSKGW